jgi:hypothetical protein
MTATHKYLQRTVSSGLTASAEGKYDRLPALAGELVRLEPHVVVAVPTRQRGP